MSFHILSNPALKTQVAKILDKTTNTQNYRDTLSRIGSFMAYEISHLLDNEKTVVQTNFAKVSGLRVMDENVIFIAVLRASIPMVYGALEIFPHAQCGMTSARRLLLKEGTTKKAAEFKVPVEYSNVPKITKDSVLIIPDPALASGTSVVTVLKTLFKKVIPKRIIVLSVVCAKEGVVNILKSFPQAEIFTAHLGHGLNSKGYIVPDGPGDAGDRSFGFGSSPHNLK